MDLNVKKNKRSIKFYQKVPHGIHCNEAKIVAAHDISKETCLNKNLKNYISSEYLVLQMTKYPEQIINI